MVILSISRLPSKANLSNQIILKFQSLKPVSLSMVGTCIISRPTKKSQEANPEKTQSLPFEFEAVFTTYWIFRGSLK